ncbi:hypothetical protein E4U17_004832 [Claviceps sp. LM77 group G4]|nr:hypothetical protein E4U17_004832 [Claviceps sp. LM77 group G4]KAG6072633.1 hypothetical protein E4U16_005195 [Claviceps sp. LM84 group G4]KAG6085862.1 hypothetical protein E4U33_000802 [Claviceps sp. LM78 group G4]
MSICPPGYRHYVCIWDEYECAHWNPCSRIPAFLIPQLTRGPRIPTNTMASSEASSTSPLPSPSPSRKTDSGITHTIPNSSVVTVTRHTVVFSEAPRSTASPSSVEAATSTSRCSTCTPTPTLTSSPLSNESERGTLSAGAIAGAATGAAIIITILFILVFVSRRRKKHRASCDASEADTLGSDSGATGSEKLNSTKDGFSRMSSDPFAPFGGRVDKPNYSYRPSTGTFELDGVAITAVELPAASMPEVSETVKTATIAPGEGSEPDTVKTAPDEASKPDIVKTAARAPDKASEPRTASPTPEPAATLASPSSPQGKIAYVNQWNEYKALAAGEIPG